MLKRRQPRGISGGGIVAAVLPPPEIARAISASPQGEGDLSFSSEEGILIYCRSRTIGQNNREVIMIAKSTRSALLLAAATGVLAAGMAATDANARVTRIVI